MPAPTPMKLLMVVPQCMRERANSVRYGFCCNFAFSIVRVSNCAHRRVLRNCMLYDVEQYWSPSLFACYAWLASTFTGEFLLVECLRCLERFFTLRDLGSGRQTRVISNVFAQFFRCTFSVRLKNFPNEKM